MDELPPDGMGNEVHVGGYAWLPKGPIPDDQVEWIREANTTRLRKSKWEDEATVVRTYDERDFWIGVGRAFYHETSAGNLPVEYHVTERPLGLDPAVEPLERYDQPGAVEAMVDHLSGGRAAEGMLKAPTGSGKTVMALLIAARLDLAPVVVTHKANLLEQWRERILEDPAVFPDAEVGVVRGKTCELGDDVDVVLAMAQTLANRPPDHPVFRWGGLAVFDEAHRMAAPTFNDAVHNFRSRARLSMTATPRRGDGGEPVFERTVGSVACEIEPDMLTPKVRFVETSFEFPKDYPRWIELQKLTRAESRNHTISREVEMARRQGRDVLVLTRRVEHVLRLKALIEDARPDDVVGLCVGSWYRRVRDDEGRVVKDGEAEALERSRNYWSWREQFREGGDWSERLVDPDEDGSPIDPDIHEVDRRDDGSIKDVKVARDSWPQERFDRAKSEADVILATFGSVKEGFDVKRLDNLHLAMPTSDPEQETGRILRDHPDKRDPIVTHYVDRRVGKYLGMARRALRTYRDLGAEMSPPRWL